MVYGQTEKQADGSRAQTRDDKIQGQVSRVRAEAQEKTSVHKSNRPEFLVQLILSVFLTTLANLNNTFLSE